MERRKVIAGNWKMNMLPNEAIDFITELTPLVKDTNNEVILCVPFTDLFYALLNVQDTNIKIGAQNMHFEEKGAFTGEVSGKMLKSIGVDYVIIGHSERRQYFAETDETVNKRVRAALDNGLKVILCVGEVLAEREQGVTFEVVGLQTKIALQGVTEEELKNVIIAYEPVWAIGTGKTATADQADEVNGYIRSVIAELYGKAAADAFVVQYGGSMNAKNADELLSKENVDGGLIGGASLKAEDFSIIVKAASK